MKRTPILLPCLLLLIICSGKQNNYVQEEYRDMDAYMSARQRLIQAEWNIRLDSQISFTAEEEEANQKLLAMKKKEFDRTKEFFPPAHNYLESKTRQQIDQSPILDIMRRLPKGGILHVHGLAMGDFGWIIDTVTYLPNCYIYQGREEPPRRGTLKTFDEPPSTDWILINELRMESPDVEKFDQELYQSITLGEEDLSAPNIWDEFIKCFARINILLDDETLWKDYSRKMLKDLIDENVQYVESRGYAGDEEIIAEIQKDFPEFKVGYIAGNGRSESREAVAQRLDLILELRVKNPNRILGYDLVEEEDKTNSNLYFINELLEARKKAKQMGTTLPLYLHSGESNWMENENILDAILLGARRIGHGLTLIKHPLLMQIARDRNIAIEVCPISNQVLGYISDLRNHPAVTYINYGLPVVICSDDPGIWKSSISHDFYEAFMAWGLDLRGLKQLAKNSLIYSAMDRQDKEEALHHWEKKWEEFIDWFLKE